MKDKCCDKIHNVTREELNAFLKKIGGLESGYSERYHGKNKVRNFLWNISAWILYKIPYDKRPRNPFRSKIDDCGYFSVGPGWYGLIKNLIEEAIKAGWNKEVCQVKEKFASLRFYVNSAPSEVHDIIHKYEVVSQSICEECGEPGEIHQISGWYRTVCEKHLKE